MLHGLALYPASGVEVHPRRTRTRQKVTTDVLLGGRHIHHLRHGNAAGALTLAPGMAAKSGGSYRQSAAQPVTSSPKGYAGASVFSLGYGGAPVAEGLLRRSVLRSGARKRVLNVGHGVACFGRAEGGLGVFDGQRKAFRCGRGLAIGGRLVRLCVSSVTPAVAVEEGWRCAVEWDASFRPRGLQGNTPQRRCVTFIFYVTTLS